MENEIYLYGTVGESFWDEEFFTATQVRADLAGRTGPLTVRINSGGGIATEGQAIYTILRDYPDHVDVVVDGIAASAASLIAMAGDTLTMRACAILMIHDPAQAYLDGRGTEDDHLQAAEMLRVISGAYAAIYAAKAGISTDEAREIMRAETYYDGPAAVAAGFADVAEDDQPAQAVAQFDYRIYAHAPASLLQGQPAVAERQRNSAVLAKMAGMAPETMKGINMPRSRIQNAPVVTNTAPVATDPAPIATDPAPVATDPAPIATDPAPVATDPAPVATDPAPIATDPAPVAVDEDMDDDDDQPADARAVAAQISDFLMTQPVSHADQMRILAQSSTLAAAARAVTDILQESNPMTDRPRMSGQRARITRDPREVRRAAMPDAILAQITGARDVQGPARDFMDMSLLEMAAVSIGHTGPLRSPAARRSVLMAATHTTSDFAGIFGDAMNRLLEDRYSYAEPTYRAISRNRNFRDFRPMPLVRAGDFPKLQPLKEGGEIKFGTFGESNEVAMLSSYGVGMNITYEMIVNDDLSAIDQVVTDYASNVAQFEEEVFYQSLAAARMSDGNPVFHASRNNLAATGTAISVTSVSKARTAMRKQLSVDGRKLNLRPAILLVGPDQELAAQQVVAETTPNTASEVNPFSGRLSVIVSAEIEDNSWYLLASPAVAGGHCFVHGFLEGSAAPVLRMDEPFGTRGLSLTVTHDFGFGAADYRGAYKNPGQA